MKKPAASTIKRTLKKLRRIIEDSPDTLESRVAQCLEAGIIWASQPTKGWALERDVKLIANIFRSNK